MQQLNTLRALLCMLLARLMSEHVHFRNHIVSERVKKTRDEVPSVELPRTDLVDFAARAGRRATSPHPTTFSSEKSYVQRALH